MTIGVALAVSGAENYVDDIVELSRKAAAAGIGSVWLGQRLDYDAGALAAIIGRDVPGLHVGTSAIPIPGRHPVLLSSLAQTAQAATHGHFHLGLALGAPHLIEQIFGLKYERPIALLREFLTALRPLLETGQADFSGELLTARTALPAAVPGAQPPVPVLVAAMGPQALRVTGELADGTLPYLASPRTLEEHIVPTITAAAERAGRPAPRIVAFVAGGYASDVDAAREKALETMAFYDPIPSYQRVIKLGGASRAGELAVLGDEKTITDEVRRYFDAGATEVVFTQLELGEPQRTFEVLGSLS
ncbi:F420-dependent oxidoreductase-like protein [Amycolatopsis bartoniae]|uniref:Putative monooxygenase (Luciferase-like) n=1 Tax=Amycolatopsis bartoniae TaxID=941986 RepID=A0A8H9IUY5_9PSEU|nr:LLM class F420-dependent oxidoreductase [Amycolatopsis bartoniae]MBB2933033.1 F420-dependent oxidoreductase-like protein [Amycolatopsis bartoniae]TVT03404.1 LLM class F420-dependent oxidoreductase [Amycolatopsis bartoniae]GHF56540.1 putative monooxygenase (luciferase-like) [Amycolatopsis bartoniae]